MGNRSVLLGRLWRLCLFALVAAAAVAFVLRTRIPELGPTPQATAGTKATGSGSGYYILFGLQRQRAEAQEESVLRTVLADKAASAADRAKASSELQVVSRAAREETEIESVLKGQGFPLSAVVISNGRAMVVVPARIMSPAVARRIGTDLWNLAGVAPENVLIRPRA